MRNIKYFYDLSKVFDLIGHNILIKKLQNYDMQERELSLLKSYLQTELVQFVEIQEERRCANYVKYGVPEYSFLDPLLTIFVYCIHSNMKIESNHIYNVDI